MKFEVVYSIGGPTLYLNDDKSEIMRIKLPREVLATIAQESIRYIMHNGTNEEKENLTIYMSAWVEIRTKRISSNEPNS